MKKKLLPFLLVLIFLPSISVHAEDQMQEIKARGELLFGTSAEYIPFVFHDQEGNLTGMDIDLVNEIGKRLGVTVKSYNMAFDGLLDAVTIGQVDLAGGALAVTPERKELVDFTNVYYTGDQELIISAKETAPDKVTNEYFKEKRIGVQRGTSFSQWVKSNLVGNGILDSRNVYEFSQESDLVKALSNGQVDMIMLDQDTYDLKYAEGGNFQLVKNDFSKEDYAFAAIKGSTLIPAVNQVLKDMISDGTAQKIANKYSTMSFDEPTDLITRSYEIKSDTEAQSAPVVQQADCINGMKFIRSVNWNFDSVFRPNTPITRTWLVQNSGTCTWDSNYTFDFLCSDRMDGQSEHIEGTVAPGQQYNLSIHITAPGYCDYFTGYWQMHAPNGKAFGDTLDVEVMVSTGNDALDWDQFLRGNGLKDSDFDF